MCEQTRKQRLPQISNLFAFVRRVLELVGNAVFELDDGSVGELDVDQDLDVLDHPDPRSHADDNVLSELLQHKTIC